jgi:hypothetical protein
VRMVVKRTWIATIVTIVVGLFVLMNQSNELLWFNIVFGVVVAVIYVVVLERFGVFPLMMAFLTSNIAGNGLTADVNKLYAPTAIWLMVLIAAMAAFGYYASRTGEPLFGKMGDR